MNTALPPPDVALSVAELNRLAREALESRFPPLWVRGEISNLSRPPSGHLYFTLKDGSAQVRCTLWHTRAQRLSLTPANGMRVEARATVSLYEPRGDYQLNVESLRHAGLGTLHEAFLRLKAKLESEGLFDPAAKRPIPRYPQSIAIITSGQAAALRDVLATLARRAPHIPLQVVPTPVQGDGAGARIAAAFGTLMAQPEAQRPDVVLLVRGGGSLEDLWAFNEECVARAIHACPVAVICGVGHETDITIADFAADLRAATPTAAAEHASAGFADAAGRLAHLETMLSRAMQRHLDTARQRIDRGALRLIHPRERLARSRKQVDALGQHLEHVMTQRRTLAAHHVRHLAHSLHARRPDVTRLQPRVERLEQRLDSALARHLEQRHARLAALAAHLEHLSPDAVLARGYSITRDPRGRIVRDAATLAPGDAITVRVQRGALDATVNTCQPPGDSTA